MSIEHQYCDFGSVISPYLIVTFMHTFMLSTPCARDTLCFCYNYVIDSKALPSLRKVGSSLTMPARILRNVLSTMTFIAI